MPILNWLGKDKVINHHQQVPYCVLEPQYTYGQADSGNMLIHGDNLDALKALLPRYEGKVKCIYIDPPYNTGNENWVYNDNVNDPKIKRWLGEVVGREGEDLSRHDKWLCMMYPRLRLLQRLLADDGAIFISIDDNEQANLKLICDEIFGGSCFITDLIWRSADSSNNDSKQFSVDYNHTLVYSKKPGWQPLRFARREENNQHYKNPDNDPRGPWFQSNLQSPNYRANLQFDIIAPNGNVIKAPKNGWRWSQEKMNDWIADGTIVFPGDQTRIIKKTYLKDQAGIVPSNIWWDVQDTGHNRNAKYELLKIFSEAHSSEVFKTPKPTKFIEKILQLFPPDDLLVLDSFAGSGTSAHAVLNMNKADGGNRRFILVEMEDYADTITAERVKRVIDGYGSTEGTGGGFTYYELGERLLLEDGSLNETLDKEKIREYVWYTETRADYIPQEEQYLLGVRASTAYYFYYEKQRVTVLDHDFLHGVKTKAGSYIIYADINTLSADEMDAANIRFKKIPRDITRL
ncbi:site-specific DNA-methyltransferase [Brevibacillus brevis]|uniref:site-specific DNA-methyltransferase n=1 Tax=Brevibacillus brevis TaxID=1393 RepID=UPI001157A5B6|nr:site-specific DNA-methyltransferase [Lysinibacillus sp. SDF0063]TQR30202.1 site-specific DNA-methyltransferase [Lysinibacillus sp. SDF0063]